MSIRKSKIDAVLAQIQGQLLTRYPRSAKKLSKPATKTQLARLERSYGRSLPGEVCALYGWGNGGEEFFGDGEHALDWLSVAEIPRDVTSSASRPAAVPSSIWTMKHESNASLPWLSRQVLGPMQKGRWRMGPELSGKAEDAATARTEKALITLIRNGKVEQAQDRAFMLVIKGKHDAAARVCRAAFDRFEHDERSAFWCAKHYLNIYAKVMTALGDSAAAAKARKLSARIQSEPFWGSENASKLAKLVYSQFGGQ
jgi:hypothetical protein